MALEKCNVISVEHNNLTGAASAVRRRLDAMPIYGSSPQDAAGGAVQVNLSYSYAGGFGAGVNVGGGGLGAGVSYNEKSGFGVSAGIMGN
ncbi:hypothetical protein, partial [Leptospira gomenensis]